MNKKKVFIFAYARTNVGDDLFIVTLLEKYKDVDFYIEVKRLEYAKAFEAYENITIIEKDQENFDNRIAEDYDGYIYVGGSIFMEGGKVYNLDEGCNYFMKQCHKKDIPFFYLSSNYGPYQTQKYYNLSQDTFKNCTDICFRDTYSYKLFKDIPTVRYAPDLIFNTEKDNIYTKKDTIGISVIDMSIRKNLTQYESTYINCMICNIIDYIKQGKEVYLFSFCKEENDEKAIENIIKQIPEQYIKNVHKVYYDGNIKDYIKKYKSMEYMICCRFHSMILSVAYEQKMYILSYSRKINNVVKDLSLVQKYMNIEDLQKTTTIDLKDFIAIDTNKLYKLKSKAKKQLEKVEEWITKND